ncbi:MAG: DUF2085 domain-containing protein [Acidobacteriota bacterium]|nr:DUF2085 domain-containing protein [Acidobacteriota bacterium]
MRHVALALTVGAVVWVLLVVAAPAGLGTASLSAIVAYLYVAGSQICHQITERSFAYGGVQFPVCARCFGLYLSGALSAALAWLWSPRQLRWTRPALLVAAIPTGATWALEFAGLVGFSNISRALAALPLGGVAGWVFVQMLRYDSESHGRQIHHSRTPARLG